MITAFLAAFGPVFLAELPDKTMFASLVLTTRTRRPLAVWSGVAGAFLVHVILAVAVGSLLRKLPTMPVRLGIAALFIAAGLFMLRSAGAADEDADDTDGPATHSFVRVAVMAASVVGVAEFGDLTQLTTAGIAARYGQPVAVAAGAWSALLSVAALAVTAGQWIVKRVPLRLIQRIGGVLFVVFGIVTAISTFS